MAVKATSGCFTTAKVDFPVVTSPGHLFRYTATLRDGTVATGILREPAVTGTVEVKVEGASPSNPVVRMTMEAVAVEVQPHIAARAVKP
jgi:hypothetical protein